MDCTCIKTLKARRRNLKRKSVLKKLVTMCKDFPHNCLTNKPSTYSMLSHLDLSKNALTSLPYSLRYFSPNLTFINLNSNALSQLPSALSKLPTLQVLLIANNVLDDIPQEAFQSLTMLSHLDLSNNRITSLPDSISSCLRLKTLVLGSVYGGNRIQSLDNVTWELLTELREVDLSCNMLKAIPSSLFLQKQHLLRVNASNNSIQSIPSSLSSCPKLSWVDLSRNGILYLPSEITQANALEHLNLSFNRICVLPGEILKCRSKTNILLSGNPFSSASGPKVLPYAQQSLPKPVALRRTATYDVWNRFVPSLKELSLRTIAHTLRTNRDIDAHSVPNTTLDALATLPKPCYYCDNVFVNEYVSHFIDECPILGFPQVPCQAHYCSDSCREAWRSECGIKDSLSNTSPSLFHQATGESSLSGRSLFNVSRGFSRSLEMEKVNLAGELLRTSLPEW
jgi:Leucine-rich repeat (LRR) protein